MTIILRRGQREALHGRVQGSRSVTDRDRDGRQQAPDPYWLERLALIAAVTDGRGCLPPEMRRAIVSRAGGRPDGGLIPETLAQFVDRVARDATVIADDDVSALTGQGFDEEAVFEAVVAAALGASLVRLERVDELLSVGD